MSITIIDVAKKAGVSFKTVSRVMNGEGGVSEKTREKVKAAARELEFEPNNAARNLRRKSANMFALVSDNPSRSYAENIQIGAMDWCSRHGFHLIVEDYDAVGKGWGDLLARQSLAGIILIPPMSDDVSICAELKRREIPFVRIAPEIPDPSVPCVRINDRKAAQDMTRYLIELGHRRIGLISGPQGYGATQNRVEGYRRALAEANIALEDALICEGAFSYESGRTCAETLLSQTTPPSAIFASNDDMAAAVIAVAYRRGLSVPLDLSVVGYDDVSIAAVIAPQLTTVRQPLKEMANRACALLRDQISDPNFVSQDIVLEHTLVRRASASQPLN